MAKKIFGERKERGMEIKQLYLYYGNWLVKACHDTEHYISKGTVCIGSLNELVLSWRLVEALLFHDAVFFPPVICFFEGEIVAYHWPNIYFWAECINMLCLLKTTKGTLYACAS